jgi:hypothetical protein
MYVGMVAEVSAWDASTLSNGETTWKTTRELVMHKRHMG